MFVWRIVTLQDSDEFILPTGASNTRGRFELAFFTIGGSCITGELVWHHATVSASSLKPSAW